MLDTRVIIGAKGDWKLRVILPNGGSGYDIGREK